MVQDVDCVCAQCERSSFLVMPALRQRQVNIRQFWPEERVSASKPERPVGLHGWGLKGSIVEPALQREGGIAVVGAGPWLGGHTCNGVGKNIASLRIVVNTAVQYRERGAALVDKRPRHAPSANYSVNDSIVVQEGLTLAKRKFVYRRPFERLRDVEVRVGVVTGGIVSALPSLLPGGAAPSGRVLVIQHMRPGVVDIEG